MELPNFEVIKIGKKVYLGGAIFWLILNTISVYLFVFGKMLVISSTESKLLEAHPYTKFVCFLVVIVLATFGLLILVGLTILPLCWNLFDDDDIKLRKKSFVQYFALGFCLVITPRFWAITSDPFSFHTKEFFILFVAGVFYSIFNDLKFVIDKSDI
jgi:hypothetical protein